MFVLVKGANGSGKSLWAETCCVQMAQDGRPLLYVATLMPADAQGAARVMRHVAMRAGKGFEVLESPFGAPVCEECGRVVLFEDVTNLLANMLFEEGLNSCQAVEKAYAVIAQWKHIAGDMVAVTMVDMEDETIEDTGTRAYLQSMATLNGRLEEEADVVIYMKDGQAHVEKDCAGGYQWEF